MKFTPAGGTVTVSARRVDGGCLALVVSDTGPGISPEDIPRALSPYQQLGDRHRSEGTGLGLPLVKSMAELHGGSFILESEVGVGTTATIVFPAKRVRAGATSA